MDDAYTSFRSEPNEDAYGYKFTTSKAVQSMNETCQNNAWAVCLATFKDAP
jgi:hypothetical protein